MLKEVEKYLGYLSLCTKQTKGKFRGKILQGPNGLNNLTTVAKIFNQFNNKFPNEFNTLVEELYQNGLDIMFLYFLTILKRSMKTNHKTILQYALLKFTEHRNKEEGGDVYELEELIPSLSYKAHNLE